MLILNLKTKLRKIPWIHKVNRIILPGNFIFLGDTLARQLTQYDLTGITPEELQKKTVADITKQNLDIIFIGINPGYHSALTGHHYSGSGTFFTILEHFVIVVIISSLHHAEFDPNDHWEGT